VATDVLLTQMADKGFHRTSIGKHIKRKAAPGFAP
jgi:hypothetical protein